MAGLRGMTYAARVLDVSPQMVRNYVDRGDLPAIRTANGQRLVTDEHLERLRRKRQAAKERREKQSAGTARGKGDRQAR